MTQSPRETNKPNVPSEALESSQTWNTEVYIKNARYVSDLGAPVVELLAPQAGERILDLGCGDGVLTREIQDRGCEVVGIDPSPDFIATAKQSGLDARVVDATRMDFRAEFDAVFSNAVLHWIKDADAVIKNVFRALRSGGRFVAEFGGKDCVKTIHQALIEELTLRGYDGEAASPWYFPSAEEYKARLVRAGFEVDYIEVFLRPTPLPQGIKGFLETFAGSFTALLPERERGSFIDAVLIRVQPELQREDGSWFADYTRLRFKAVKP